MSEKEKADVIEESNDTGVETITLPRNKLKERLERAKRQVVKQYGGLSPENVNQLQERIDDLEAERGKWQELELSYVTRTKELEQHLANAEELRKEELVRGELSKLFLGSDGLPDALHDAMNSMVNSQVQFELNPNAGLMVHGAENECISGSEFIEKFLAGRSYFKKASSSRGSGIPNTLCSHTGGSFSGENGIVLDSRERRLAAARKMSRE